MTIGEQAKPASPFLIFLPYLRLKEVVTFGDWEMGPIQHFEGRWADGRFEDLSNRFIAAFHGRNGRPIEGSTLVAPRNAQIEGRLPPEPEMRALAAAINFAVLDSNPRFDDPNGGHFAVTSDNTELLVWPIELASGFVAFRHVGAVSRLDGGYRIEEGLAIPPPRELVIPLGDTSPDPEVLQAIYDMAIGRSPQPDDRFSRRLITTITWLAQAWRNSESIRPQDRVVLLKTGFEALTAESQNWPCAKRLRALYENNLGLSAVTDEETRDLLWKPGEVERFNWTVRDTIHRVTDLQQWLYRFGDARNKVIHDGKVPSLQVADQTAYDGPLFNVGERLLRETIKVSMIALGFEDLWRPRLTRLLTRAITEEISEGGPDLP